ncbi:Manganese transport system membrane protein MntB [bacterium HR21]|nr:Manganese transport system membrane protein MntB [bacterium HR21]
MEWFTPVVLGVVVGNLLIALGCASVGSFALLRREVLFGDVLAHAALPGIGLAYLVSRRVELPILLLGAAVTMGAAVALSRVLQRVTHLAEDLRLGVVLSVSFGAGIVVLTLLQQWQDPQQMSLWRFLFGQAAAVSWNDVVMIAAVVVPVLAFLALAFKELVALAFDAEFVRALPLPLRWVEVGFSMALVLVIVVSIQSVGVVLMVALLVLPPMAARLWVRRVGALVVGAVVVAMVSVLLGVWVSLAVPRVPTGPVIVTIAALLGALSHLVAPRRGLLARLWDRLRRAVQRWDEHAHKVLYRLGEERQSWRTAAWRRAAARENAPWIALWLWLRGSVRWHPAAGWTATEAGCRRARRIVRRHRLWELYLERVLGLAPEDVHAEAELVEHVLSAELEAQLEAMLGYPHHDPHGRPIPPGEP